MFIVTRAHKNLSVIRSKKIVDRDEVKNKISLYHIATESRTTTAENGSIIRLSLYCFTPTKKDKDRNMAGPDPAVTAAIERGNAVVFFDVALGEGANSADLGRIKMELFVRDVSVTMRCVLMDCTRLMVGLR